MYTTEDLEVMRLMGVRLFIQWKNDPMKMDEYLEALEVVCEDQDQ